MVSAGLDRVLSRIGSLESWVDEWKVGREHEQGVATRSLGHNEEQRRFPAWSAANYAQYVMFLDMSEAAGP